MATLERGEREGADRRPLISGAQLGDGGAATSFFPSVPSVPLLPLASQVE